jgi:tetratricopeptide (TPR) repeat protein
LLCIATANAAPANDFVSRHKLQTLLRAGDFNALERTLGGLEKAYEAGRISDDVVDHTYYAFSVADPGFEARLDEWAAAKPKSHRALLGRGAYRRNLGWVYRGDAYYNKTPKPRIRQMQDQFALAKQDLRAVLALKPNSGVAYSYLIEMQVADGSIKRRDALLNAGLRADPTSTGIRRSYLFGLLPWWGGGPMSAKTADYPVQLPVASRRFVAEIERDAATTPRVRPLLGYLDYTTALILTREGRYQEGAEYYDRAIAAGDLWLFHGGAGKNYFWMQNYDKAIASFNRALELRPDIQDFFSWRSWAHGAKGQTEKAIDDINAAVALDPKDPDLLLQQGRTLQHVGRRKEALEAFNAAMLYGEFDDEIWFFRGSLYVNQFSDTKRGLPDLKRARELAPDKSLYFYHYWYARLRSWH